MITLTATITLADGTEISIDRHNMLSIETSIVNRNDINLPNAGIISNGGNLSFIDYDKEVKKTVSQPNLIKNAKATIYLNNTLTNESTQVGEFYTSNWNYNGINYVVSIDFKDNLEQWQNINIDGFSINIAMTGSDIYDYLKSNTPQKWEFEDLDDDTNKILKQYYVKFPYIKKDTLWRQWCKLCDACGLTIYKNPKGKVVVSYIFTRGY